MSPKTTINKATEITYLIDSISIILILVFTYTAVAKLTDYNTFRFQMLSQPLPSFFNHLLVWLLPPLELYIVLLLLFRRTRLYGLLASIILMTAFTGYVALMVLKVFDDVPCSCGGILQSLSWGEHLAVNFVLLIFSIIAFIQERRYNTEKIL